MTLSTQPAGQNVMRDFAMPLETTYYHSLHSRESESTVRDLVMEIFGTSSKSADDAFIKAGMSLPELVRLYELIRDNDCRSALEVGMGSGTSSVVVARALQHNGASSLISIDPFQSLPDGFASAGIQNLRKANLDHGHRLIEKPNYLALPALLEEGKKFDFIFIDGWHSFDYAFLDIFYSDLLLEDGGILTLHDTTAPPVFKAVRFLETHKPYQRLSPPLMMGIKPLAARLWRRARIALQGRTAIALARSRREDWRMLAAYRKLESRQTPETLNRSF